MARQYAKRPTKKGKTIRMKKADAQAWLAALRLPENQKRQGRGQLFNATSTRAKHGYCCLGVLQQVVSGGVERAQGYPSPGWLKKNGISFVNRHGTQVCNPTIELTKGVHGLTASEANDEKKHTFAQIAKYLSKVIEVY